MYESEVVKMRWIATRSEEEERKRRGGAWSEGALSFVHDLGIVMVMTMVGGVPLGKKSTL